MCLTALIPMSSIPPELQHHIVSLIGVASKPRSEHHPYWDLRTINRTDALRACSLVCHAWHTWTLKYTFATVIVSSSTGQLPSERNPWRPGTTRTPRTRLESLLHFLDTNPAIRPVVKCLVIDVYTAEDVLPVEEEAELVVGSQVYEGPYAHPFLRSNDVLPGDGISYHQLLRLSSYISNVECVTILHKPSPSGARDGGFSPNLLQALCAMCAKSTLHTISFAGPDLPKVLLRCPPNLKTLRLFFGDLSTQTPISETVGTSGQCVLQELHLASAGSFSMMKELVRLTQNEGYFSKLLSAITTVRADAWELSTLTAAVKPILFSENLRHLWLITSSSLDYTDGTPIYYLSEIKYDHITAVDVIASEYRRTCPVPWASIPNLTRITFEVRYAWYFHSQFPIPAPLNWKAGTLPVLLDPAADLGRLERLDLRYNLVGSPMAFSDGFNATLVAMYSPFEALLRRGGFVSLRNFSTHIVLSNTTGIWFEKTMGEDKLYKAVMDVLPSLSGCGGRLELEDGWVVDVDVDIEAGKDISTDGGRAGTGA